MTTTFEPFSPFMTPGEDLLKQTIRTNIRGILDSYHGDWDFLIEMLQNAVDALEEKFDKGGSIPTGDPKLEILIDYQLDRVRVSDNGVGMTPELARSIFSPSFTTKPYYSGPGRRSVRGHKGVGLTFLAFSTDSLTFCTKRDSHIGFAGELREGRSWVRGEEQGKSEPKIVPSPFAPEFLATRNSGTSFELKIDDLSRFGLSWLGWYTIIRTSTAAGFCDINGLHSWNKGAKVELRIVSRTGSLVTPPEGFSTEFPLLYLYPHNLLEARDLDEYHRQREGRTSVPSAERRKYEALYVRWDTDRIEERLFNKGDIEPDTEKYQQYLFAREHLPSIYALFTHSQRVWHDRLDQGLSTDRRRRIWRAGVQVVTHQMPTGERVEISLPFRAGNKDRVLILLELDDVKPDYGRKGFRSDVTRFAQFVASEVINYFVDNRELLRPTAVAHGPTPTDAEALADYRIISAQALPDLGLPGLICQKEPQFENDVIALFSELAARGQIKGFEILSTSSGSQYDAVVNYRFSKTAELIYDAVRNPLGVPKTNLARNDLLAKNLEFKKSLESLITDFEEGTKAANQVRFVVCWDEGGLQNSGFELVDLMGPGDHQRRTFHGQTHILVPDSGELPVFMLRAVVSELKKASRPR